MPVSFFSLRFEKETGEEKPDARNSQITKPSRLRVPKSPVRFFCDVLLELEIANWLVRGRAKNALDRIAHERLLAVQKKLKAGY